MGADKDLNLKQPGIAPAVSVGDQGESMVELIKRANFELEKELQNTRVLSRNLIGAMRQLEKSKGKPHRIHWTKIVNAWRDQLIGVMNKKQPRDQDSVNDAYNELRMLIDLLSTDSRINGDLLYRFDAFVFTLLNDRVKSLTVNPKDESNNIQGN